MLHLHEPMTPTPCIAALALLGRADRRDPSRERRPRLDAARHAGLGLPRATGSTGGSPSPSRRASRRSAGCPGEYEIVPNGVAHPGRRRPRRPRAPRSSSSAATSRARACTCCCGRGPRSGAGPARGCGIIGADPLAVRLLLTRLRVPDDGIDVLGFLSQADLTAELVSAKALVAPSLGGESFGMVLTRAFACATPVVASDIPGYRDVMTPETAVAVPPGDPDALADAIAALLDDEPRRAALGTAARLLAIERYSWDDIARRLVAIYDAARAGEPVEPVAA